MCRALAVEADGHSHRAVHAEEDLAVVEVEPVHGEAGKREAKTEHERSPSADHHSSLARKAAD